MTANITDRETGDINVRTDGRTHRHLGRSLPWTGLMAGVQETLRSKEQAAPQHGM